MRPVLSIFLYLFLLTGLFAQEDGDGKKPSKTFYLFPDFEDARILFKSGTEKQAVFNYNVVTEEMIYNSKGEFMALEMPGIDTIYVAGKKFIPFGERFYEVVWTPPGLLYIRHYSKLSDKGRPVGYGGYSQGAATTSFKNITTSGALYELEVADQFELADGTAFLIRKGKQFHEVNSTRQTIKAFPGKKDTIKDFVKEHKTDFNKPEDVMKLLQVLQ